MSDSGFPPPPPPPPPTGDGGGIPAPPPAAGGYVQPVQRQRAKANFGQRLLAMILDGLILGIPSGIAQVAIAAAVPKEIVSCRSGTALCEQPTSGGAAVILLFSLVIFVLGVWYYAYFEGVKGQTLGKQALGIRVVGSDTGEPVGIGRGIGRYFARFLSAIPILLGYFWMIWDPERQTFHDKIVRTYVVKD